MEDIENDHAERAGLEPTLTILKTVVLPLNYPPRNYKTMNLTFFKAEKINVEYFCISKKIYPHLVNAPKYK